MNSLQLKYFLAAAEGGSLSKTADAFFISQPALSKQIRRLEEELGITLFRRGSGGVALTEAGKLLYRHFSAMNLSFAEVLREARRLNGEEGTTLRIGLPEDWDVSRFTVGVKEPFSRRFPDVKICSFCSHSLTDLTGQLQENRLDALFLPFIPSPHMEGITTIRLVEVPLALVASRDHPLWNGGNPEVGDFSDELFLVAGNERMDIAARALHRYLAPYRFIPRVESRDNMSSVILGVLNGEGVTIRDVWALSLNNPRLRSIPLSAVQNMYLAIRTEDRNPHLRGFAELILNHFGSEDMRHEEN